MAGVAAGWTLAASVACAQSDDVQRWLDRMTVASEELNYRGTYVHVVDGNAETLHIVHRYANGAVYERLSSGDGGGRELLRTGEAVSSTFPERRLIVVEAPQPPSVPIATFGYTGDLERYYQMTTFPRGTVADRPTQIVSIRARDEYRYGYLLWLDRNTALPLKMQVRDEAGRVVESILFTEIDLLDSIPETAIAPATRVEGFTLREPLPAVLDASDDGIWVSTRLPSGFRLSMSRQAMIAGSPYPVRHLVYTDGLASVSVYIAHPLAESDMPAGFSRFGSSNAYSLTIDGQLATALGEVPRLTVQRIAASLDKR